MRGHYMREEDTGEAGEVRVEAVETMTPGEECDTDQRVEEQCPGDQVSGDQVEDEGSRLVDQDQAQEEQQGHGDGSGDEALELG